ncbi:hypothetical protein G6F22_016893 [Rhizopus arrhizus]|nr:hypothetical protein G6F22_016893 [Rhizopus arrhizus]
MNREQRRLPCRPATHGRRTTLGGTVLAGVPMRASRLTSAAVALSSALILSACGGRAADSTLLRESFDSGDTFSRTVDGRPGDACEAARRTLLSQGYAIARSDEAQVEGNKNFQPRDDDHEQLRGAGPLRTEEEPDVGQRGRGCLGLGVAAVR